jgi:hypothetical protein
MQDRASKNESNKKNPAISQLKMESRQRELNRDSFFGFVAIQVLFGYNIRIDEVEL